ncbi:MAG TPA: SAM-dependent methyltransferase [Terriglobales bacterium]
MSSEDGRFVEQFVPPTPAVAEFVKKYAVQPGPHERVDAPLLAQSAMQQIAALMKHKRGYCVFVDYGYVQGEMFAGRHLGTVTSFRRHTVSNTCYEAPGEQDITVHVNFTVLADAARQHSLDPLAWVTQAQFLMGIGEESQFAEAFEDCKLPQEHAKRALQLKHLITPEGMGESFHVLVLASNLEKEKAARLDGLKFVRLSNQI